MTSKEYIKAKIDEIICRIPAIKFDYKYDELAQTHFICVYPQVYFDKSNEIADFDIQLSVELSKLYPDELLCLIDEKSHYKIDEPDMTFVGSEFGLENRFYNYETNGSYSVWTKEEVKLSLKGTDALVLSNELLFDRIIGTGFILTSILSQEEDFLSKDYKYAMAA